MGKICLLILWASLLLIPTPAFAKEKIQPAAQEAVIYIDADTAYEDCAKAAIVVVPDNRLATVKDYAKKLVDDGKILYIQDVSQNKEALADYLSIPKATRSVYNNMPHVAAALYQASGCYVFSYIYVQIHAWTGRDSRPSPANLKETVPIQDGLASACALYEAANHAPSLPNAATGTPAEVAEIFSDAVTIYGAKGSRLGDGLAVQYLYKRGNGTVNGRQMYIFDIVTAFTGVPTGDQYLQAYQGRLRCNIGDHILLDYTILPSNTGAPSTLQLGGRLSDGTSWTYTPGSQIITTNGAPSSGYVDYFARPQGKRHGHAWEMLPGMEVATSSGIGGRGAFSKLTIPVLGILGRRVEYTVEVGGWF